MKPGRVSVEQQWMTVSCSKDLGIVDAVLVEYLPFYPSASLECAVHVITISHLTQRVRPCLLKAHVTRGAV